MSKQQSSNLESVKRELAARILARRRLLPYVQRMNPQYKAGWVHHDICNRLERFSHAVEAGTSPRLMILMPPRHGKSMLASQCFPSWHLGRVPEHEIIACSYNISLAMTFSRKVKALIDDPDYHVIFDTRLNPDNKSTEEWGILGKPGGYVAAGVGGGITGKGANVLLIDDPVKNAEEADSAQIRESVWDWYGSTAYTRLAPGGGVLVIQTCWHDDDLAGRLQQAMRSDEEADQFEIVKYPAIAEADEWLDPATEDIVRVYYTTPEERGTQPDNFKFLRAKGEALHPERYDITKLNRIKRTIQPRFWSALYQQNPVPDDGVYFKREYFRRAAIPRSNFNIFMAWDFAISEKQQNDYTVGSVGLQDDDDIIHVAEVVRFKSGDSSYIVEAIINMVVRWQSKSRALVVGVEDGQIWRALKTLLKKRMRERGVIFSVEELKPITDKMSRARALQGRLQQGMVSFDETAPWYDVVQQELLRFPAGVHDDCVDSLAWMSLLALDHEPPRKPQKKRKESWKDRIGTRTEASHMAA